MGIMLVYDITNEKSFENIVKWLRNINEVYICIYYYSLFVKVPTHCSDGGELLQDTLLII